MSAPGDNSYLITGKVCPPKLPIQKVSEGWNLTPSLLESLFNEVSLQGRQPNNSHSLCALSFQASVWLSTDGLSASSVGGLPYFLCNFCHYHTDSKAKLLQHIVCRHVFKCKLCDFVSFSLNELIQHQLHKHLDDEEMQPALNSKIILMNLSHLQRNSHIFSHRDSISYSSKCSGGKPAESEVANSSVINISNVCPTGHQNHQTQQENEQLEHTTVKNESPVTSSKDKPHHVDATGTVSKPHWNMLNDSNKRESSSKRSHSHGGFSDCELSPKRFRKTCHENSEASDALLDQSQRHSNHMPHFLDDSDSYVTSSCSPHKNASPVLLEMREEPNSHDKTQSEAEETYSADQVLSFFMEPTSSAISRDLEKSGARDHENSASQLGPLSKMSSLYDDFYCESVSNKQVDMHLSGMDQMLPGCSRTDQSILSKVSKEADTLEEESQHSELSVLSRAGLQMQPDMETSRGSPGPLQESCTDILEILQQRNNLSQSRSFASHKTLELSISKVDDVTDKSSRRRQSHSKDVTSGDLENFLILPGNNAENTNLKENQSLSVDSRNDTSEHYGKHRLSENDEAQLSVREKESYDLLRRLLLGTASSKDIATTRPQEKQTEIVTNKDVSTCYFTQTKEDNAGHQSHSPVVTRASDMSLRDLLTQGLGSIHQSLFFQCNYCSFKSINKAESQKHIKLCKFRFAQKKTKTVEILTKSDCEASMTNTDNPSKSLDSDYSSEKFVASELLKGISEHYCESLSGDVSLYDKSHELNSENQLYTCDKPHTLQHEQQVSVPDKSCASKSLGQEYSRDKSSIFKSDGQIYSCDKSHTLKSDIEMNSCDISYVLKNDAQVGAFHLGDHADGHGRRHTSSDIVINASKNVIHKSGQNLEPDWNYYSEDLDGLGNYSSGEKPDESHVKMEEASRLRISLNRKHDLNIGEEFLFPDQNLPSERQHKSRYACTYCDFSTNNVTYVRQHLFESHPTNASFVEAAIPQKGKTSLYLCRGTKSTCTFVSSENAEIFQHIKLCYCGYLDNFIHTNNMISPDYSHVLFCLGQASGFINTSAETFHCLRCSYYAPEFQQVAGHISDNHAGLVAGVLSVNNSFIEPRIRMVCLLCKAHISVKYWAFHHCRKRSETDFSTQDSADLGSRDHCATRLEAILRQSSLTRHQPLSYGNSRSLNSLSLVSDTGMTVFSDQENCRSQVKINRQSLSSNEPVSNQIYVSNRPSSVRKSFNENTRTEAVGIKQEIPDVALQEVQNDDVMVHFKQERLVETDDDGTGLMPFRDIESSSQKARTTNASQTSNRKLTAASSVLHSLLTATGSIELSQQGFSSLHKLLQSDLAAEDKRPSKEIPDLQADFMSVADLHSQYPCILEILKRQESALQETGTDNASLSSTDGVQQEESRDFVTRQSSSVLLNALCHPHVLSQQIHNAATTCLPKLHLLLPGEESVRKTRRPKSLAATVESQDTTGPFTNLLQLLCKSKKLDP